LESLGIIAATGALPELIARHASQLGHDVYIIGFHGFTDPKLKDLAKKFQWFRLGQLEKPIAFFRENRVDRVVMAGKIEKSNLLRPWNIRFDRRALRMVRNLPDWKDDTVLVAIGNEFQKDGVNIEEITPWAAEIMAPNGILTRKKPNEKQWRDIRFGRSMALGVGGLDIGQTVIIKNQAVVAVEAIEGTDRAIRRVSDIGVRHAVVVKMAKPDQDMRFDVPGVGPSTIESMAHAKAKVLAMEAGKTMIAEREKMIKLADRAGMVVLGIPAQGPVDRF
jgi:hypothetical protein